MNVYDPTEDISYVHLAGPADIRSAPADAATACRPLPSGYANWSTRTRLQQRADDVWGEIEPPVAGARR